MQALVEAILLIEHDLDLPVVLENIVRRATELSGATYGALAVFDQTRDGFAEFVTVGAHEEELSRALGHSPEGRRTLRLLLEEGRPVRLGDLRRHQASPDVPFGYPPMQSFLGVPITVQGEVFGNLYLCDKEGGSEFSEEDEYLMSGLALAAGLAIDKARLYTRLRELALSEERERIARNLHDTVIQRLFAVGMALQSASRLPGRGEAQERIQGAIDDLDETIRQIRTTIFAISRPRHASGHGLRAQILDLTDEAAGRLGMDVRVDFEGPIDTVVGPQIAEHLLVSLREGISNVVRHARASTVEVDVKVDEEVLELRVKDDGIGIEAGFATSDGRGLPNLAERAKLLGGSSRVVGGPEGGTELTWQVRLLR